MDLMTMMMLASLVASGVQGMGNLSGKNEKYGSTYSPEQRSGIGDILQRIKGIGGASDISQSQNYNTGQGWLQGMFNNPDFFNQFEAPLQRQFQEQTVPDLANRFASMGSGGALGSTGFRNQLAREGSNLSTNLGALRGGMQQQAIPQLLGYAQQPFSNIMSMYQQALQPTNNQYQPASAGFFGNIASGLSSGAAQGFGNQWGQNMANRFPGQSATTV